MTTSAQKSDVRQHVLDAISRHPVGALLGAERICRWSGLESLWHIYRDIPTETVDFATSMLAGLSIRWEISAGELATIPDQGPLLIVANHPTGGAEGLIAHSLLANRRNDVRVFSNSLLDHVPELACRQFNVRRHGEARSAMMEAVRHLKAQGAVLMFPAGTVAHWQRGRGYAEAPWHPSAARLAVVTSAIVQPLEFQARPTWRWRVLSALSRGARTALLPRELLAQQGKTITVAVRPTLPDTDAIKAYFRDRI